MDAKFLHDWPIDRREAHHLQKEASQRITLVPEFEEPKLIAAVDTATGYGGEMLYAAAVVTSFPEVEVVERSFYHGTMSFPYVPGLKYYREGPIIVKALANLSTEPDLIIVHGHGIAHPKRCGMACQIGLTFDKPTIGCARKLLAGRFREVPEIKGSSQPIHLNEKVVGVAYRSKDKVKPVFISPAYKIDLERARDLSLRNLRGYRLPEPLRLAHLFANKYKRRIEKGGRKRNKTDKSEIA